KAETLVESARSMQGINAFQRAQVLFAAADIASRRGEFEEADLLVDQGFDIIHARGISRHLWSWQLLNVTFSLVLREDYEKARTTLEDYLGDEVVKAPLPLTAAYAQLGVVALFQHQPAEAAAHFRRVVALGHEAGVRWQVRESLHGLAAVAAVG